MMGGFGSLGILFPVLFFIGFIALVVWAIARIFPSEQRETSVGSREDSAEEILRQRYARGEIDEGDYESVRRVLKKK